MRTYLVREALKHRTRISVENHVFLFFAVVKMSFTPAKIVMLAALLSSFLGFLFSVGQVDVFASRSVQAEELITTTANSSMVFFYPYLSHAVRESVDTMWRGFSRL